MTPLDQAAVDRVRDALEDLMRCRPEDWPELLPGIAGGVCRLNPLMMDLLADAAVQVAATAHQLALEAEDDADSGGDNHADLS